MITIDDLEFYKERRIVFWIIGIIIMLGLSEGMNAYIVEGNFSWNIYALYWMIFTFMVLMVLSIIPLMTRKTEDWILVIGLAFLSQFLEDVMHIIAYGILSGKFILWTPLWDWLGISFPIPLFWILDFVLFGVTFMIFLAHRLR